MSASSPGCSACAYSAGIPVPLLMAAAQCALRGGRQSGEAQWLGQSPGWSGCDDAVCGRTGQKSTEFQSLPRPHPVLCRLLFHLSARIGTGLAQHSRPVVYLPLLLNETLLPDASPAGSIENSVSPPCPGRRRCAGFEGRIERLALAPPDVASATAGSVVVDLATAASTVVDFRFFELTGLRTAATRASSRFHNVEDSRSSEQPRRTRSRTG